MKERLALRGRQVSNQSNGSFPRGSEKGSPTAQKPGHPPRGGSHPRQPPPPKKGGKS